MKNILIIGCGLIGSSLLRAIYKKKLAKKILIYEKSKSNIAKIKRLRLPGTIVKTLKEGASNSDLIFFCTPMSEYKKIIPKINNFILPNTIITDIGSSKTESSKVIKKFLKKGLHWIPSHPIAGSEVSGPEHGKENMFINRWCILVKDKNTKKNYLYKLIKFWKKIGSKVIVMTSDKHDKIFSITSHLPHLIAYNLVKSAQDYEKKQNFELIKFSAGGVKRFFKNSRL
ncbi:prephenate dehydrogenase/arogenate dehydrogenase family protein [Candidatus Pelagibacter sp.]|nr:prephenate dehydrogenase/arogenate dehydrogenase family protein [Candidatus Pelagibacter sp.]